MRNILFIACIALLAFESQAQDIAQAFEQVKKQDDVEGFVWKGESTYTDFALEKLDDYMDDDAVILNKTIYLTTQKIGKKLRYWFMDRDVIFIRNKEAIEDFSTISLSNRAVKDKFSDHAVRVFKKNGEIIYLRKADYIEDGDELKAVIPNLEEGDIIDQYSFIRDDAFFYVFRILADDEIYFANKFPVLDHYCEFILKNGSYFKFTPLNGAPEIKIEKNNLPYGVNARVIIHDKDRPGYDVDDRWVYPLREFPMVRYALAVGTGYNADFQANFFNKEQYAITETKDGMISEFLKRRTKSDYSATGIKKKYIKGIKSRIAEKGFRTKREKVAEFYNEILYTVHNEMGLGNYYNGTSFMMPYVAQYCREIGVPSRWNYVFPRFFGDKEGLFLPGELYRLFEMDFDEGTEYMQFVSQLYPFGFYSSYMGDSDCYSVANRPGADTGGWGLKSESRIPLSTAENNRLDVELWVTVEEDAIIGELNHSQFGNESAGSTRPCDNGEFDCDVIQRMLGGQHVVSHREGKSKYSIEELTDLKGPESTTENLQKYAKWMISTVDKELKERFGEDNLEDVESMKILNTGLLNTEEGFSYKAPIKVNELTKKVGPNQVVNIGQLIGGQVQVSQEKRERRSDVYYNFPRTYNNTIHFEIPDGYSVEGVDELASNIDNDMGSFISTTSMEGDTLTIMTTKMYKSNHVDVAQWPMVLEFLDAAYDFSQKKVLLKPISSN